MSRECSPLLKEEYKINKTTLDFSNKSPELPSQKQDLNIKKIALYILTVGIAYLFEKIYYNFGTSIKHEWTETGDKESDNLIKNLLNLKMVNTTSFTVLQNKCKDNEKIVFYGTCPDFDSNFKTQVQENKTIIIPLMAKGFFRDHIITFIIDADKNEIFFIDPKGQTIKDHQSSKIVNTDISFQKMWKEVMKAIELANKAVKEWTFYQNTSEIQKDGFNCGVHFYHNVEKYLLNKEIPSALLSKNDTNAKREQIVNDTIEYAKLLPSVKDNNSFLW